MSARTLFITGTDTGVGKTVVMALIASCLQKRGIDTGVMKPFASGAETEDGRVMNRDVGFYRRVLDLKDPDNLVNPVCYRAPLAPAVAAREEGTVADFTIIDAAYDELRERHELLLIEGVGGLCVPLSDDYTVADLVRRWKAPLLIVARPGLGTINHTGLTVSYARGRGIEIAGFLFNDSREITRDISTLSNPSVIKRLCGVPFCGRMPYGGTDPASPAAWKELCRIMEKRVLPRIEECLAL